MYGVCRCISIRKSNLFFIVIVLQKTNKSIRVNVISQLSHFQSESSTIKNEHK